MVDKLIHRIKRKLLKLRFQPIHVYCFHHVSDTYDAATMWDEDWTQTEALKQFVNRLQQKGYIFISLPEAHERLKQDKFRRKKFAVLTADDGYKTLYNILPWFQEMQIPVTLFINPKYILEDEIDSDTQRRMQQSKISKDSASLYLKSMDIQMLQSPLVTFGHHGFEHLDEWNINKEEFKRNLDLCVSAMRESFKNVIPYYAHTYGHTNSGNDEVLQEFGLIPVYTAGNANYNISAVIDRELISQERLQHNLL